MTNAELTQGQAAAARRIALKGKHAVLAGFIILGIPAIVYGNEWWTTGRFVERTDDAYVSGDITVMAPKVPGLIAGVAITDNQEVHAGDLLIKIDDRDYQAALAKAEANLSGQKATIANIDAQHNLQEAVIAQAKAGIASADAEVTRTHYDYERYEQLSDRSAASIQIFQKADSDYKQALANGEKARAALDAAERQLDVIATQRQRAEAALDEATSERDIAKRNLSYTEVHSPISGYVSNRAAEVGSYVFSGSYLLSIVPAHDLWVNANFKEDQLERMAPGLSATVVADTLPSHTFHGHIVSLAHGTGAIFSVIPPENATGNFTKIVQRVPVRIALDLDDTMLRSLRPGLSMTASVDTRMNIAGDQ